MTDRLTVGSEAGTEPDRDPSGRGANAASSKARACGCGICAICDPGAYARTEAQAALDAVRKSANPFDPFETAVLAALDALDARLKALENEAIKRDQRESGAFI